MKNLIALVFAVLLWNPETHAQQGTLWMDVPEPAVTVAGQRQIVPLDYRTLRLNVEAMRTLMNAAPVEGTVALRQSPSVVEMPMPGGETQRFRFVESPIMEMALAARFPRIRTFLGQGIDDPTATIRFDMTPAGFHAMILSAGPTVYIDPYASQDVRHYISYFKHAIVHDGSRGLDETGVVDPGGESAAEIARLVGQQRTVAIGEQLRTYRIAVATTGEYTTFHGGTVSSGLAAVVTAMNRVNQIYEREVAIRMVLIANNDQIIYTNASTDPYTNNSGSTMLGQNQTNLDNVIGNANYDIGHVFSTGGGGVAGLGVVCRTGSKARGVTGLPSPIGDPFYVDYVAHEIGHQFGGNHTFNGNSGSCSGGNRNGSTAYEPGSGTTVMAYAGICSPQNTQNFSDDYFHGISIDEIVAYSTLGSGSLCPVVTSTGNNAPVVNAGSPGRTIPINTPFMLTGSATDGDGDALTFTWEQFDLGSAGHPNSPVGNAPIFRSFKGTSNPSRVFPRLSDILGNVQTLGEILPSYGRTMNFRLTARDNRAGGGGVGKASTTVVATSSAGPFTIISPNTPITWLTNSVDTVKWNVANTNAAPVNCAFVNILLSLDGGQTFPVVLAANTPNDGIEAVNVPANISFTARVRVEAVDNIFFDISRANFSISTVASPALTFPENNAIDQQVSLTARWRRAGGATSYHVQLSRDAQFTTLTLNDSTLTDTTTQFTAMTNNVQYFWRVRAKNAQGVSGWSDIWNFRTVRVPPATPPLQSPPDQSGNLPSFITFRWGGVIFATSYRLEVATDTTFTQPVLVDTTLAGTQLGVSLAAGTRYVWRVRASNAGGSSAPSSTWSFTTQQFPAQVVLQSPVNLATISSDTLLLVWSSGGTQEERYWLELATDPLFASSTIDSTLTDTSKVVRQLQNNQGYWWKVRAGNNAGWGPFSQTRRFSVIVTSVAGTPSLPTEYMLAQNYPNPFNPSTVVAYALPQETRVTLEVYSLIGERIAVLVDGMQPAGFYSATFDAAGLASGLYIYRMRAGTFQQTKKLMLLR